ncbi:hypothetical protein EDM58_16975 [Brevibacillus panacihumi]|uniref:Uncharacterized protein n=1 Tax=Brevibacillus panacihumi TaxID=497735 RepID=A0A3M8CM24_9BACL|nr:hypothetical protein EDM58_16975 [Brevibacillus panacihumi]
MKGETQPGQKSRGNRHIRRILLQAGMKRYIVMHLFAYPSAGSQQNAAVPTRRHRKHHLRSSGYRFDRADQHAAGTAHGLFQGKRLQLLDRPKTLHLPTLHVKAVIGRQMLDACKGSAVTRP